MDRFGWGHLIDNETQRRITGSSVDLMVAATIMSIKVAFLAEFIVPILAVCLSLLTTTALLCFGFGRHLKELGIERALTSFGCCCGSTGTGLLLLRIVDPDMSSPIPKELALFNIAILFFALHILTFMAPILPTYDLTTIVIVYVSTFLVGGALLVLLTRRMSDQVMQQQLPQ
jgi:ESS family glutamate:Na+ symporter